MSPNQFVDLCAMHGLAPSRPLRDLVRDALAQQREACARLCESVARNANDPTASRCAEIIRAGVVE